MRAVGALLILCACGKLGLEQALRLHRRVRSLTALIDALSLLRAEIVQNLRPLPALMELLSRRAPRAARPLFHAVYAELDRLGEEPFSALWNDGVQRARRELFLREEECEALCALGAVLGGTAQEQDRAVALCLTRLSDFLRGARARVGERSRLYAALGFSAGFLLVILLV